MVFRYCLSHPLDDRRSPNKCFRKDAYLVGNLGSDESCPGWDCSSRINGTLVWQRTYCYSYEGIKSQLVSLFPKPFFFSFFVLQVFLPVPFVMVAMSFFLVLAPIVWSPNLQYVYAFLFMLGSLIVYLPFIHFKLHFSFLDKITCHLQLLLEVSPADGSAEGKCE